MGSCCCREGRDARTIVVLGTPGSGVTTVARRLRDACAARSADNSAPRDVGSSREDEAWYPSPLPSVALDAPAVPVQHQGALVRIVDAGPCTVRAPLPRPAASDGKVGSHSTSGGREGGGYVPEPERHAREALSRCHGVVLVVDASRPLAAQAAAAVATLVARTKADQRPMIVLLTKYDTATKRTLPAFLSPRLVASALELRGRRGLWACYPCVATHRRLNLLPTLGWLLAPERISSARAVPIYDVANTHEGKPATKSGSRNPHGLPATPEAAGGYVAYSDGVSYAPQPVLPPARSAKTRHAAAASAADEPTPRVAALSLEDHAATSPVEAFSGSDDDDIEMAVAPAARPAHTRTASGAAAGSPIVPPAARLAQQVSVATNKKKGYKRLARAT